MATNDINSMQRAKKQQNSVFKYQAHRSFLYMLYGSLRVKKRDHA